MEQNSRIKVLDCTLRDGGYVNDFEFGENIIKSIVGKLEEASIDIIECGFLMKGKTGGNKTLFASAEQIKSLLSSKMPNTLYVAMIAYGDIGSDDISPYDGNSIDGIRITFHEHEIDSAFQLAASLKEKGYKVFIQPVGTMAYSDSMLLKLLDKTNSLEPYAFYIVDTLGTMYQNELRRLFYLVDHNLKEEIHFGFHSHNNLQLSFSNAQDLLSINTRRSVIIDSSIMGMGRGAGNLCTELIVRYINENIAAKYDIFPLLEAIDEYIMPISQEHTWGYSAPYYVASINKCHPNYASHLMNKQTVRARDIYQILNSIPLEKRHLYDRDYIENSYLNYQSHTCDDHLAGEKIAELIQSHSVLLVAPGPSINTSHPQIEEYIHRENALVFSINFVPPELNPDVVFVSNLRRFPALAPDLDKNYITLITSNLPAKQKENRYIINYASYLNEDASISDNAGLMLINFLASIGLKKIALAGFDGFQERPEGNFYNNAMVNAVDLQEQKRKNQAMSSYFSKMKNKINFIFLTPSKYNEE